MNKDNFWAELDSSRSQNNNFWSELDTQTNQQNSQPTLGNRIASGVKSVVSGAIGAIPDSLAAVYNIPTMAGNAAVDLQNHPSAIKAKERLMQLDPSTYKFDESTKRPLIPSVTEGVNKGIDTLTGGYTDTPQDGQKHINTGIEFATSLYAPGKLAQNVANKGISKVAGYLGSTNPWQVGAAGTAGTVMSGMQDSGASTGQTLAAGAAINLIPGITPSLARGTFSLAGLGKNNLDVNTVKAAKDLDITLPKAVASNSKMIALADQFLSKAPIAGDIMQKRYAKIGEKVIKTLDDAYDSIISSKELQGVDKKINDLYDKSRTMLPQDAIVTPSNTLDKIEEIKNSIKTASPSADEQTLLAEIGKIENFFAPYGSKNIPASVDYLVGTKKSLNGTIKWDMDQGVKNRLKEIQHALQNDIGEYGKTNKDWYKYYTGADELYSKVAKREQLEYLLTGKSTNQATGEVTYSNLSKVMHADKTASQLKKLVEPEVFDKLQKLGTVSRAMAIKNKNLPNPSGTAPTQSLINWMTGITGAGAYKVGALEPMTAITGVLGATGVAHLLTDKKSLDAAIRLVESGEKAAVTDFNKRMKAITGYTPITLIRELNKEGQKDSPEWPSFDKNKFLEESKKWDDRSSFILTPEEMRKMRENKRD